MIPATKYAIKTHTSSSTIMQSTEINLTNNYCHHKDKYQVTSISSAWLASETKPWFRTFTRKPS